MSKIKRYLEDVITDTATAMLTEAKDELEAYGHYADSAALEFDLYEKMNSEGVKSIWSMVNGLIGDMNWNASHPLLDEVKNRLLVLVPFGELAKDLAQFHDDFDPYDFRNSADSIDEATEANIDILEMHDEGVVEWLDECIEEMGSDEVWGDLPTTCKSLKERVQLAYQRNF